MDDLSVDPDTGRFSLSDLNTARSATRAFSEDVRIGLTSSPKALRPIYFYDDLGSRLFQAICALPEYYVARAEMEILVNHAAEFLSRLSLPVRLLELGSGDCEKTRYLIDAILKRQRRLTFIPIDISKTTLIEASTALLRVFPGLRIQAYTGDYQSDLGGLAPALSPLADGSTLVVFLGSSIGNLHPTEARQLLSSVCALLRPGDGFLLGADLKKREDVLIPAYDDPLGVTAAFNLNLLVRMNRELNADFDLSGFKHRAIYNASDGRIEMHLVSLKDQVVYVQKLGLDVPFQKGEIVLSECSYKFDRGQLHDLGASAGLHLSRVWTDERGLFSLNSFEVL